MTICKISPCKRVKTKSEKRVSNGSLTEMFTEGRKTLMYLTTIRKGSMKGYHLHNIRAARYFPIAGKILVKLYSGSVKEEYVLDARNPQSLYIPPFVATALFNIGKTEAKLINFPTPPYDPWLTHEQEEYTEEELEKIYAEMYEM